MRSLVRTLTSSIGMKIVMAVTGAGLVLFLIGHLLGNLEIFAGQEALNAYAKRLRFLPPLLWVIRIGLATCVVLHIAAAVRLSVLNRAARPVGYARKQNVTTGWGAGTMLLTGILLFFFVGYHLMHFTFQTTNPEYRQMDDALGRHDVYRMVGNAFRRAPVAAVYVVAMLFLGLHVSHGVASVFQSLGMTHPRYSKTWHRLGPVFAAIVVVGFVSIPLSVLLGLIKPPDGGW